MQYRRRFELAVIGLALVWAQSVAWAQGMLPGDPHLRVAGSPAQAESAAQRFLHCDLTRQVSEAVIVPQRVKDWIDTAFFVPVRSAESLLDRLPALSAREDIQAWLRDARVEQQAAVRLLRGTPPSARPAGVELWRVPLRLRHVTRIARDDDGQVGLERSDFADFLGQPDQRGGLDSLGRQMLVATLARVVRLNPQQREQCHLQGCELRILAKTGTTPNGWDKETWLGDVQLWAAGARISVPNLSVDGQELPSTVDLYLNEQASTLACVVPAAFRR